MAESDRDRWNDRYRNEAYDFTPAAWLRALEPQLRQRPSGACALDLACGGGRNALYLAELGYTVEAWDLSDVGLAHLTDELTRRLALGHQLAVRPRRVDLEHTQLPPSAFDLVLDAHYLDRALFPSIPEALRPGGLLIINTFLWTPDGPSTSRLSNPAYALRPGELRAAFADLEILELIEDPQTERAQLVARARSAPLRRAANT